jgi:ribonuclease HI
MRPDGPAIGSSAGATKDGPSTVVYTDGACRGNPGPGGWAWAVPGGRFASGAARHTTNQRMEITAVLEALRTLTGSETPAAAGTQADETAVTIEVVSDSTYVVRCFTDRWWEGWRRRNWKNSQNKPVANRDLWEPLLELALSPDVAVTFRWVKGHSGDRWNDRVDELATLAADMGRGTSG